jgi:hypothetical protein
MAEACEEERKIRGPKRGLNEYGDHHQGGIQATLEYD